MLILALLLTASPLATGEVLAAPFDVMIPGPGTDLGVTIPLTVTPITTFGLGTITVVLHFGDTGLTGNYTTDAVYATLRTNPVVSVPYVLPAGFGDNGVKIGTGSTYSIIDSNITFRIYLDQISSGGGGGGGTIPSGGSTTSGTDTGWQRYDSSTDTSTVYVDPELTQELFSQPPPTGVVLVETPVDQEGEVPQNVTANLPLEVVTQGGSVTVPSILNMGSISMELPPSVMQSLAQSVQNLAGGLGSLRVEVIASTPEGTTDTLNSLEDVDLTDMNAASQVITVSFVVVNAQGHETKITVERTSISLSFNPDVVTDPSKVNLYMIGSLIYVGGKVDPVTTRSSRISR